MPAVNDLDTTITALIYGRRTILYTTEDIPSRNALIKLPPNEQIDIICERYRFWILNIAQTLSENVDNGYAVLALLNSYFEMIAQLSGVKGSSSKCVKTGLCMVFPELETEFAIVTLLYDRLRNPMAHMGLTSDRILLITTYDKPLVWGKRRGVNIVVINSQLWVKQISRHFEQFEAQLRDPDQQYDLLRRNFLARIKEGN